MTNEMNDDVVYKKDLSTGPGSTTFIVIHLDIPIIAPSVADLVGVGSITI